MRILIIKCTDPHLWYAKLVGEYVPYRGFIVEEKLYKSRQRDGYTNFVQERDGKLVPEERS